jgi:hypothetical protein
MKQIRKTGDASYMIGASVLRDGTVYWYQDSTLLLARRGNAPAIIGPNGDGTWYEHGKISRYRFAPLARGGRW